LRFRLSQALLGIESAEIRHCHLLPSPPCPCWKPAT
jgi:hypothetical protein